MTRNSQIVVAKPDKLTCDIPVYSCCCRTQSKGRSKRSAVLISVVFVVLSRLERGLSWIEFAFCNDYFIRRGEYMYT